MGCPCSLSKSSKSKKQQKQVIRANLNLRIKPAFYHIIYDYEIAELTKISRRFYRITGLKEVLDRFKNPSRLNDGEEIIKCCNVEEINNTFFFEENKNANESDKHSYDIIADQYGNNYQFAAEQIISNNRSLNVMHSKSLNSCHKDKVDLIENKASGFK